MIISARTPFHLTNRSNTLTQKLCFDIILHRKVIVSVISKDKIKPAYIAKNKTVSRLLDNQIAVMKKIRHPNILSLYDVVIDPDCDLVYLASEYRPGVTTYSFLEQSPIVKMDQLRKYTRQLVDAIDFCHNTAGILHRNINLKNILLTNSDDILVSNVGHSFLLNLEQMSANIKENILFTAPELYKDESSWSYSTDIWALGVCLYFMAEGAFPFNGHNADQLIKITETTK